jgi:hypothetical protein
MAQNQASGIRNQESGIRFQVSGFRFQVSGFRLQASGFRLQASGFNYHLPNVLGISIHNPPKKPLRSPMRQDVFLTACFVP